MERNQWVLCPLCNSKTRVQIRKDTELRYFPLFCPKCKQETIVHIKETKLTVVQPELELAENVNE